MVMFKQKVFVLLTMLFALNGCRDLPMYANERLVEEHTEYIVGDVNILVSAAHGGYDSIVGATARAQCEESDHGIDGCDGTLLRDSYTKEILEDIYDAVADLSNTKIWTVATQMHRKYGDLNRESLGHEHQGCCLEPDWPLSDEVHNAYDQFHGRIRDFQSHVQNQEGKLGLIVDLHGHAHSRAMLEVGVGISASRLRSIREPDYEYDSSDFSSLTLKNSAKLPLFGTFNVDSEVNTLTGPKSFGALAQTELENVDFELPTGVSVEVCPSPEVEAPESGDSYFSGGWNTRHYSDDTHIDTVQLEASQYMRGKFDGKWDHVENRKRYALAIAKTIVDYARQLNILEDGYYVSLTGQCHNELHRINDPDTCEAAAEALGLSDQTAGDASSSSNPKGCYLNTANDLLWYNEEGSTDVTSPQRRAICYFLPTANPSLSPSTSMPSFSPTLFPTTNMPSVAPSTSPTTTSKPTKSPTPPTTTTTSSALCLPGFPYCKYEYERSFNGICEGDNVWIETLEECNFAYSRLGLTGDSDGEASVSNNARLPQRCYYKASSKTKKLWFNNAGRDDVLSTSRTALCRKLNGRRVLSDRKTTSNDGDGLEIKLFLIFVFGLMFGIFVCRKEPENHVMENDVEMAKNQTPAAHYVFGAC